jgi:hypothetical protein
VRALVKASRSVILYDTANQTVHDFLEELRDRLEGFLAAHGALALTIRPYDILHNGEVIYHERERERSLALRLHRDGVRRITIEPDVTWDEVSQLIGILAVRFKGVRLQEEDIVTMLWKASLAHVNVDAVEGFVVAEQGELSDLAGTDPHSSVRAAALLAPYLFDEPWPQLPDRRPVSFAPVSAAALARIAAEDSEAALPSNCLDLVHEVMEALADPAAGLAPADVAPLLREVREFLVAENRPDLVVALASAVAGALPAATTSQRDELLGVCLDGATLRSLLRSGRDVTSLASLLTAAHLDTLLDLLSEGLEDDTQRERLLRLVPAAAAGRAEALRARLNTVGGEAAARLLRVLERISPDQASQAAAEALAAADPVLQRAALELLRGAPYGPRIGRALVAALDADGEEVRLGALQLLVTQRERRAFLPLAERVRRLSAGSVSAREAMAYGAALALLDGAEALKLFRAWVKPSAGLLGKVIRHAPLLVVAAGGLARLAGEEADELLRVLAKSGPDEVRAACQAQLDRRGRGVA